MRINQRKHLRFNDFINFCESTPSFCLKSRQYLYDHDIRLYDSFRMLKQYISSGMEIISFGGGGCFIEMALANSFHIKLTSFDFQKSYEKNAASYRKYNIQFIEGNFLHDLNKVSNQYDAIIMSEFIEHIPMSLSRQLSMVKPFLKNDGLLFISTPNFANIYNCLNLFLGNKNLIPSDKLLFESVNQKFQHVHRREYIFQEIEESMIEERFCVIGKKFSEGSSHRSIKMKLMKPIQLLFNRFYPYCLVLSKYNQDMTS